MSQHPTCQKRGTVVGLVDRAFLLSHLQFHQKNFNFIINILLENNYPLDFIFQTLYNRLKYLFITLNTNNHNSYNKDTELNKKFFTIPYVPSISKKFTS